MVSVFTIYLGARALVYFQTHMSLKMPTVKRREKKRSEEKRREEKNITDLGLGPDKINSVQFKLFYFIFFPPQVHRR